MDKLIERATEHARAGDLEQAGVLCRERLGAAPADAEALHLYGVLHSLQGDFERAIELLRDAISRGGANAKFYLNLGNAFRGKGRLADAMAAYRQAAALEPASSDACYNLAVVHAQAGDREVAIAEYRRALARAPDFAQAHNNLAVLLLETGNGEAAVSAARRATALAPDMGLFVYNLGRCLDAIGELEAAAENYARAAELDPDRADAWQALGKVRARQQRYPEALAAYEKAARLDPAGVDAIARLAFELEQANRLDAARSLLLGGLDLAPGEPVLNLVAAKIARRGGDVEGALTRLRAQVLPAGRPDVAAALSHELGQLYDRTGDAESAFASFEEANRQQTAALAEQRLDADRYPRFVEAWRRDFGPRWAASLAAVDPAGNGPAPVFLVGFPRSGTTLLDQILDSHPGLTVLEEKPLVAGLLQRVELLPEGFPTALTRLSAGQQGILRKDYYRMAGEYLSPGGGGTLVDKLPLNIVRVPLMWRVFPDAKFILALRHPCDVCLSCFMHLFAANEAMANFTTLGDTVGLYARVMGLWLQYRRDLPLSVHPVRYEDLVADLPGQARLLLDFLDLPWDDAVLRFHEHARARERIDTPSYHQVTEPVYQRAAHRWERYRDRFEPFMEQLGPFIEAFGY